MSSGDSGRPEPLWPLFTTIERLGGVGPKTAKLLSDAGISRPRDLLFTLPYSGVDRQLRRSVRDVTLPATVTVEVEVIAHLPARVKSAPTRIQVSDAGTAFQLVFFHARADYLLKLLPPGERRIVSGRAEAFDSIIQMTHPEFVVTNAEADTVPSFEPVYSLHGGVTQKTMWKASRSALKMLPDLAEWIDPPLMQREAWPDWRHAVIAAHGPGAFADLQAEAPARLRLAYDELLAHQLTLALARNRARRGKGRPTAGDGALRARVIAALPYTPTAAQSRALSEIAGDMAGPLRMNRLLQGDVGSGKTLVAFLALLLAVEAGGQGALMAPTEILARQHFEGLQDFARAAGVQLCLLTGRDKGAERERKLGSITSGEAGIVIGTHALFQRDIAFHDLRLVVIDEQHRFGVEQRMELASKGWRADVLVMTATPIPRSLALSQFGDMDLSILDEKPPGRSPVTTALVSTDRLEEVVGHLRRAVAEGRQAYWVCPLVGESETSDLTAAEERFRFLRSALGEEVVGLVHGQLPHADKDAAMADFQAGKTKVLVATTVIEVGVNVPNASIMVIERAEGFGLAQLHQLRGRVGRGAVQSTCLLLYQPPLSETALRRLKILRETEDGFRIAEEDLAIRGAGDMIGTAQSGLPRFRIADLERQSGLMALAQKDARKLLLEDPDLSSPRGRAARILLWLMEQEKAIRLISVG